MVKDLEDSPRDEALVVLDADVAFDVGTPPESSFELAVSAAGSILRAHAGRGRRAGLLVNGIEPRYQQVHSLDGDWGLALELLASARAEGHSPVAALLVAGAGMPSKALELCVVTSGLSARLADRLQADGDELLVPRRQARAQAGHGASLHQEDVAPSQDLPVAAERSPMAGVEPGRKAVQEAATDRRRAVEDLEVRPAEGDGARPRAVIAHRLPGPTRLPLERTPYRPRALRSAQLARHRL